MQVYCFKCRAKKAIKDAITKTMDDGKRVTQGICPSCGAKLIKFDKAG
jgi:hypothetical protein